MTCQIETNKRIKKMINLSHANSKLENCLCCGIKTESFCNSHSIPRFVLKNISENGMVLSSNHFFEMPHMNIESGLNNSGIFKRICKNCDNSFFKNYENEKFILEKPTKKIMTQIDLKNTLRMYDKRLNEISLYNIYMEEYPCNSILMHKQKINYLDLEEIKDEFNSDMNILNNESFETFDLIYWKLLDYNTPIAFQGHIALYGDLEGNLINNIYNYDKKYIVEYINLCVFPLSNGQTSISLFVRRKNKKYKNFIKQFIKLSESNKQKLLSFIIYNYSEDYFMSKEMCEELLNNKEIQMIAKNTIDIIVPDKRMFNNIKIKKLNELKMYESFPNILGKEYAINQKNAIR